MGADGRGCGVPFLSSAPLKVDRASVWFPFNGASLPGHPLDQSSGSVPSHVRGASRDAYRGGYALGTTPRQWDIPLPSRKRFSFVASQIVFDNAPVMGSQSMTRPSCFLRPIPPDIWGKGAS